MISIINIESIMIVFFTLAIILTLSIIIKDNF
jgi:hypothetical protein